MAAAQILVGHLRSLGQDWRDVGPGPDARGVDRVFGRASDPDVRLDVQITTAEHLAWNEVGRTGGASRDGLTAEQLAEEVWAAVLGKSRTDHTGVLLANDAQTPDAHGFVQVADTYRAAHGQATIDFGFQSVWLVGAGVESVFRLDKVS